MMKTQTLGVRLLCIVQLLCAVVVIWYFLTPGIAILGTTEEVGVSAALLGVCHEEDLDDSLGFLSEGGVEENVMNVTEFASFLLKGEQNIMQSLQGVKDVPYEMMFAITGCIISGVCLYATFFSACIELCFAAYGIFFPPSPDKKGILSFKPNVRALLFFYCALALVQLLVFHQFNSALEGYNIGLRVMLVDTWHPLVLLVGMLLIFCVAQRILSTIFRDDEKTPHPNTQGGDAA